MELSLPSLIRFPPETVAPVGPRVTVSLVSKPGYVSLTFTPPCP